MKQIVSKPGFRVSYPVRCYQTDTIPDIQQMALGVFIYVSLMSERRVGGA